MNVLPGTWQVALILTLLLLILLGFMLLLLRKRPDHFPRIQVGVDARHGYAPQPDERDSLALFRRIMVDQRTRRGF